MESDFQFDYEEFHNLLLDAARTAFLDFQQKHFGETFYAFGLLTSATHMYLHPLANTEERLTETAQELLKQDYDWGRGWYDGLTMDDMRAYLRHLYGKPLEKYYHLFEEVSQIAHERAEALFGIYMKVDKESGWDKANEIVFPHEVKFENTCYSVLAQLDRKGVFGKGEVRQKVIVNLLMTEDDEPYLYNASKLNPPPVVDRCRNELAAANRLQEVITNNQRGRNRKTT